MRTTVIIQNLKCAGCKNSIDRKLSKIIGISNLSIDVSTRSISFEYTTDNAMEGLRGQLDIMGYPITGDPNTIMAKAKSYMSCAVGKFKA